MGPIGVKWHLAPLLPGNPVSENSKRAVSASEFGSASVLPVSWAYLLMMGGDGLSKATRIAILNANYIAHRLKERYTICYIGNHGLVAHECIIDTRETVAGTKLTVDDIAKRLIDHGFHPPTMSWPVAGTLMVEPTESEPKAELDRFCDAMLEIADEVDAIRNGAVDPSNNQITNSPHTLEDVMGEWTRPYSKRSGCFPAGVSKNRQILATG